MLDKEQMREYQRKWHRDNRERCRVMAKAWRDKNREKWNATRKAYRKLNIAREMERARQRNFKVRFGIIQTLGGKCNCCGETAYSMLDVDHVKNDGNSHRSERRQRASYWVYKDIITSGFDRSRFQILCRNCNWSKWINKGVCEHEMIRVACNLLVA